MKKTINQESNHNALHITYANTIHFLKASCASAEVTSLSVNALLPVSMAGAEGGVFALVNIHLTPETCRDIQGHNSID